MKKILSMMLLGLMMASCNTQPMNETEAKLIGQWYNPYSYKNAGELKGFDFKKNGECVSIGVEGLELSTWEVKDDTLFIKGKELDKDGKTWIDYSTKERIEKLNDDSLRVVAQEKPFKLSFLYMKLESMKKIVKVNPQE